MNLETFLQWASIVVAVVGIWACACRLNVMSKKTTPVLVRGQFVLLLAGFASAGLGIFWPAGVGLLLLMLSVIGFLLLGARRWRHGPPRDVRTDHAPLDSGALHHVSGGRK